jgi:hypothetical protein
MRRALLPACAALLLALSGCGGGGAAGGCDALTADLESAIADAQACTADADCGLPIEATGCQPECELVARLDADLTTVDTLLDEVVAQQCPFPWEPRCDCPEPVGAVCTDAGTCEWDWGG